MLVSSLLDLMLMLILMSLYIHETDKAEIWKVKIKVSRCSGSTPISLKTEIKMSS